MSRIERNITRGVRRYRVQITRRTRDNPEGGTGIGCFDTIAEARAFRDAIERRLPKRQGGPPATGRETYAQRKARLIRSGMCTRCGAEPLTPGMVSCAECRRIDKINRGIEPNEEVSIER